MRVEHTAEGYQRASLRLTVVVVALGVSLSGNLVIGLVALSVRQTVLVPMLPGAVVLSQTGGVSADYLETAPRTTSPSSTSRSSRSPMRPPTRRSATP